MHRSNKRLETPRSSTKSIGRKSSKSKTPKKSTFENGFNGTRLHGSHLMMRSVSPPSHPENRRPMYGPGYKWIRKRDLSTMARVFSAESANDRSM